MTSRIARSKVSTCSRAIVSAVSPSPSQILLEQLLLVFDDVLELGRECGVTLHGDVEDAEREVVVVVEGGGEVVVLGAVVGEAVDAAIKLEQGLRGDHVVRESPASLRNRARRSERARTRVPALLFPQCSLDRWCSGALWRDDFRRLDRSKRTHENRRA
jgi:hypothetical protein